MFIAIPLLDIQKVGGDVRWSWRHWNWRCCESIKPDVILLETRRLPLVSYQCSQLNLAVLCKIYICICALLQSKFAQVPRIDISGRHSSLVERAVLHCTLHLTGHCTVNYICVHCTLQDTSVLFSFNVCTPYSVRCNALQFCVQHCKSPHNFVVATVALL